MYRFFYTIVWFFAIPFIVIAFIFGVMRCCRRVNKYLAKPYLYTSQQRYTWAMKTIKRFLYIKRIQIDVDGLSLLPKTPSLIIANHKSNIDPIALFKILYTHKNSRYNEFEWVYVAKKEISKNKFMFNLLTLIDVVFIDRNDIRQQVKAYQTQLDLVRKEKKSMVIFIEGTRHYHHEIGEFKAGGLRLAYDCMIPIVPIAIYGSSGLLDSNKKYRNRRREIWFKILKPLGIFEFSHNSSVWISENLRERIAIAYHRMHENDVNHKEVFAI